tara:strand:- start:39 stop:221 length:183 start_codon:yes stop_codon:yes gene_type:complete
MIIRDPETNEDVEVLTAEEWASQEEPEPDFDQMYAVHLERKAEEANWDNYEMERMAEASW